MMPTLRSVRLVGPAVLAVLPLTLAAQPALTIYNENFAVVRERVPLDLKAGENAVTFTGVTVHLEPDSVVLRDPRGEVDLAILEQSYRADTISQGLLLSLYEGKEIDFLIRDQNAKEYVVKGRVIRSGYTPNTGAAAMYGQQYLQRQQALGQRAGTPIIEVDGKLRFSLPGEPLFPPLSDDAILKPMLSWTIAASEAAKLEAELSYITGGMSWQAAYNLVAPEKGNRVDLVGWVTIDNQSGKEFENATLKLMAGDVSKLQPGEGRDRYAVQDMMAMRAEMAPQVTEKAFDEFHLYSLPRPTTLRDREMKQVEFVRATGIEAATIYVYDGAALAQYRGWNPEMIRNNPEYGTQSNPKVWVMREFKNSDENGLGVPLPKGRMRFYRRDDADGRLEFTGENTIDHTARNETVRVYTGDAFDVVGERKRTNYQMSARQDWADESFEIRVRNRKTEPVDVRVVEHLYRWVNWEILEQSHDFEKTDAQTVEFRVNVPADGEVVITYRVRYTWQ